MVQTGPGVDVRVFPRGRFSKLWTGFSRPLARFIKSEAAYYDVIHVHEMWHYPQHVASHEARKRNIPLVVSPRGCLTPLALANDRLLKIAYTRLVQRKILEDASLLHALTGQEKDQIRGYGVSTHTEVIPSGVVLDAGPDIYATEHGGQGGDGSRPFELLFLGRVIPNKGPDLLVEALAELKRRGHSVKLVIAGPCSSEYYTLLSSRVERLGISDETSFAGFVTGEGKAKAFSRANAFVLPSYSEGFSVAALEAMSWGLPVVLSKQCNFPEAAEAGAGLEVEPEAGPLAAAVEWLLEEPERARMMGRRARSLVEQKYTWDAIGAEVLEAYRRLLPGHPAPGG
jgi:glycosyltransferase involved in cell wall biosynthesis